MNNNKIISALVIVVAVVAGGWYALSGHGSNTVVATVNGAPITSRQLSLAELQVASEQGITATSTAAQAEFQSPALDLLIGQVLLEQAAEQAGVMGSSTAVTAQLAAAKAGFSTQSEYEQALAAHGMTEADLRTQISTNLLINTYLDQHLNLLTATATDAEIQAAYNLVSSQQSGKTPVPPLAQVRPQVAQMVVQQKQQQSVDAYVAQLRSAATIKILIATSTPATSTTYPGK
jgi:hypothetical protein